MSHLVQKVLDRAHEAHRKCEEGKVADYIPELGKASVFSYGLSVITVEGSEFEAGDSGCAFTLQSISKALAYAWALDRIGRRKVFSRVGVEPSGDAFNSIVLDEKSGRPFNPMVNSGAIAITSLLMEEEVLGHPDNFLQICGKAAGRELEYDRAVYESEKETGHRNRAIAWLMLAGKMIHGDVEEVLSNYFWQCSVLVTARDLAAMGATLANHGENPLTGEQVFDEAIIQDVLSVMFLCGMYNFSGEWTCRAGVPAKSGVAGGILAVANRQLGIGVYSPPLDSRGTSVRGIKACQDLSQELGLHAFSSRNHASNFLQNLAG